MAKHVHCEEIKAWADGAQIQWLNCADEWRDCAENRPEWSPQAKYRVKPKTIRYRVALMRGGCGGRSAMATACNLGGMGGYNFETEPDFIRWLGDEQEVEVAS